MAAQEFHVLVGAFTLNRQDYDLDASAYLPAVWTRDSMSAAEGAALLSFYDRVPEARAGLAATVEETGAGPFFDTAGQLWDMTLNDPNLKHLGIS